MAGSHSGDPVERSGARRPSRDPASADENRGTAHATVAAGPQRPPPPTPLVGAGCAGLIALRDGVMRMNALPLSGGGASLVGPRFASFAIVLVAAGVLGGLTLALDSGERRDLPAAGFAGAALGLLAAAVW